MSFEEMQTGTVRQERRERTFRDVTWIFFFFFEIYTESLSNIFGERQVKFEIWKYLLH